MAKSSIEVIELRVTPKMDMAWRTVAKDCIELAIKEWRNVTFTFNS